MSQWFLEPKMVKAAAVDEENEDDEIIDITATAVFIFALLARVGS